MKRKMDVVAGTVTFSFTGLEDIVVRPEDLCEDARRYAPLAGIVQAAGDEAAIEKTEANGWTVTEAMRREAVLAKIEQFKTVGWYAAPGTVRVKSAEEIKRLQETNKTLLDEINELKAKLAT